MEQARIKVNTERAKTALRKIHEKHDKPFKERMIYRMFIKEKWVDKEKTELEITVKNKVVQKGILPADFLRETQFDFNRFDVPQDEYEVTIK